MHPCYTCHGSIGGEPDTILELREQADPYRVECPACENKRRNNGRDLLLLPLPTARERRQHKAGKLHDPWWHIRIHHAQTHPDR